MKFTTYYLSLPTWRFHSTSFLCKLHDVLERLINTGVTLCSRRNSYKMSVGKLKRKTTFETWCMQKDKKVGKIWCDNVVSTKFIQNNVQRRAFVTAVVNTVLPTERCYYLHAYLLLIFVEWGYVSSVTSLLTLRSSVIIVTLEIATRPVLRHTVSEQENEWPNGVIRHHIHIFFWA